MGALAKTTNTQIEGNHREEQMDGHGRVFSPKGLLLLVVWVFLGLFGGSSA